MSMTDISFLFIFMLVVLLVIMLKPRLQKYALIQLSLLFYACGSTEYLELFVSLIVLTVAAAYGIQKAVSVNKSKDKKSSLPQILLIMGIGLNLLILVYFKVYVLKRTDRLLPLGISFYTFKAISLLVDVYRGTVILTHNPFESVLYLAFFGQVVSGPICRYNDFFRYEKEEKNGHFNWQDFSEGCYLFVRGLVKKILVANMLSPVVGEIFGMDPAKSAASLLWLGSICFSIQLYYDFSGYSDMAIGVSEMLGIYCPSNFNYPYATASVSEFWRRWHISLGAWFRDYIYIPMGGSRVKTRGRLYFNLLTVWLLTGLWHGVDWCFVIWGLSYFVVIALEKTFDLPNRFRSKKIKGIYRMMTLLFINFEWVLFNASDLRKALSYLKHMFYIHGEQVANYRAFVLFKEYGVIIVGAMIFATPIVEWVKKRFLNNRKYEGVVEGVFGILLSMAFLCAVCLLVSKQNNPFLYGNF